jgi:hypothetical protein
LSSQEDIENLLSHFEWTPTTQHSEAEIRRMRVELVRESHVLVKDDAAFRLQVGTMKRKSRDESRLIVAFWKTRLMRQTRAH